MILKYINELFVRFVTIFPFSKVAIAKFVFFKLLQVASLKFIEPVLRFDSLEPPCGLVAVVMAITLCVVGGG